MVLSLLIPSSDRGNQCLSGEPCAGCAVYRIVHAWKTELAKNGSAEVMRDTVRPSVAVSQGRRISHHYGRSLNLPVQMCESWQPWSAPPALIGPGSARCRRLTALARTMRRRQGVATWKPGAKDSGTERELSHFIANAEEKRKASLDSVAAIRDMAGIRGKSATSRTTSLI